MYLASPVIKDELFDKIAAAAAAEPYGGCAKCKIRAEQGVCCNDCSIARNASQAASVVMLLYLLVTQLQGPGLSRLAHG